MHGGVSNDCKVQIVPIHAKNLESDANRKSLLKDLDGILVAPGFGERGTDGKIEAVKYARENKIPFFDTISCEIPYKIILNHCFVLFLTFYT